MVDGKIDTSCITEKNIPNDITVEAMMEVEYLKANPEAGKKYNDICTMLEDILEEIDNRPAYLNLVYLDLKVSMTFKNWYVIDKNGEFSNCINQLLHDNHLLSLYLDEKLVAKMNKKTFTNISKSMKMLPYCHVLCKIEVIVNDNIRDNDVVIATK